MGACSSHLFIHPFLSLPPSSAAFLRLHDQTVMEEELLAFFFFYLAFFLFINTYTAGIIKAVVGWRAGSFLKLDR